MALQRTANENGRGVAATAAYDVAVIRCEGEMGEVELFQVSEELVRLSARGCRKVVLDLTGVDHVDYRGIRPVAARGRALRASGGDLKLCGLSPYIAAIFRAAGADEDFELYRTSQEAQAAFIEAPSLAVVRG